MHNSTWFDRWTDMLTKFDVTREDYLKTSGYGMDDFETRQIDEKDKKKLNLYFWN